MGTDADLPEVVEAPGTDVWAEALAERQRLALQLWALQRALSDSLKLRYDALLRSQIALREATERLQQSTEPLYRVEPLLRPQE